MRHLPCAVEKEVCESSRHIPMAAESAQNLTSLRCWHRAEAMDEVILEVSGLQLQRAEDVGCPALPRASSAQLIAEQRAQRVGDHAMRLEGPDPALEPPASSTSDEGGGEGEGEGEG